MNGILFKDWKIKFIAESDRELQTRRLGGLKEINQNPDEWEAPIKVVNNTHPAKSGDWLFQHKTQLTLCVIARPPYQVGEVVYIKEAYKVIGTSTLRQGDKAVKEAGIDYKDGTRIDRPCPLSILADQQWHSPMMMPAWAARRFIKITGVRAERLQEITVGDAKREGMVEKTEEEFRAYIHYPIIDRFKRLWNSINPKYPWESNPWVFVYSFKRVEAEK